MFVFAEVENRAVVVVNNHAAGPLGFLACFFEEDILHCVSKWMRAISKKNMENSITRVKASSSSVYIEYREGVAGDGLKS